LVWNAISSITPMIWLICLDEPSIARMASIASATTAPLLSASVRAAHRVGDFLGAVGGAADVGGDLIECSGGFFQACSLAFGAPRHLVGGLADVAGA
jgi:hypothetical protein